MSTEESGRKVPYNSDRSHDKNKHIDWGTVPCEFRYPVNCIDGHQVKNYCDEWCSKREIEDTCPYCGTKEGKRPAGVPAVPFVCFTPIGLFYSHLPFPSLGSGMKYLPHFLILIIILLKMIMIKITSMIMNFVLVAKALVEDFSTYLLKSHHVCA